MAKQTELGHVCPTKSGGQLFRSHCSVSSHQRNFGLLVFKEIRTSILMASIQTEMATNTHNESSLESDPTVRGDQAELTARNKPPKFTFRA